MVTNIRSRSCKFSYTHTERRDSHEDDLAEITDIAPYS